MTCVACCLGVWDGVKCQKEDGLDKILEGVFLELDWMDYPPFPPPENQQIEAVFRMKIPSVGSSFPGIPVSGSNGSRDPCFPGCTISSPNTWRTFGRKKLGAGVRSILYPPTARYWRLRINPIDTDTQSLTCNPSQNEGYKKEIAPSRYWHMTSGSIFNLRFFWVNVSKGVNFLPLHLLLSARFRVQLAACPGDLGKRYHGRWLQCVVWSCKQCLLLQELGVGWKLQDAQNSWYSL